MEKTILRVNMASRSAARQPVPAEWSLLGGRGLSSTIIAREVPPDCWPLGPENKLVFAPGLLSGSPLSSSNRLSAGAKSPLTGGIKESNSGGLGGLRLARLGIQALIIEGKASEGATWTGLIIDKNGVRFDELEELAGLCTYEAAERLRGRYGARAALMIAGPAAEMGLSTAGINVNDPEGEPCRLLARGGLGAVMASKGLKAIVVDDQGTRSVVEGNAAAREAIKRFAEALRANPVTGGLFAKYGTARTLGIVNTLGGLPTRNFTQGAFELAENIGGEALYETIHGRGGMPDHPCMPGCLIRCSNKYVDAEGRPLVGSLDYETLCLMGSNLGIGDLDQIAVLNRACNELGIDTMETGAALGVLAEAGIMGFGDFQRARELLEEVGRGTPMGRLLGSGSVVCGRVFGVQRVPAVKGQGMAAYDPRVIKGTGVTYATSPMGADHTAANTIITAVDHLDPQGKVKLSVDLQVFTMVLDSLGMCIFTSRPILEDPALIENLAASYLGRAVGFAEMKKRAAEVLRRERTFNEGAGILAVHDRLPGFFATETLPPTNARFDISAEELAGSSAFLDEQ